VVGKDGNRDGLPTVLTEAMALKVPVVATPVTGIPELVEDGRTGLLVSERDARALADAIGRLLHEPDTAARLAAAARERVERDFDLRENVRQLRALFEESGAR
jgi:glycosyltransferase involved in cell wall biosynthesis